MLDKCICCTHTPITRYSRYTLQDIQDITLQDIHLRVLVESVIRITALAESLR